MHNELYFCFLEHLQQGITIVDLRRHFGLHYKLVYKYMERTTKSGVTVQRGGGNTMRKFCAKALATATKPELSKPEKIECKRMKRQRIMKYLQVNKMETRQQLMKVYNENLEFPTRTVVKLTYKPFMKLLKGWEEEGIVSITNATINGSVKLTIVTLPQYAHNSDLLDDFTETAKARAFETRNSYYDARKREVDKLAFFNNVERMLDNMDITMQSIDRSSHMMSSMSSFLSKVNDDLLNIVPTEAAATMIFAEAEKPSTSLSASASVLVQDEGMVVEETPDRMNDNSLSHSSLSRHTMRSEPSSEKNKPAQFEASLSPQRSALSLDIASSPLLPVTPTTVSSSKKRKRDVAPTTPTTKDSSEVIERYEARQKYSFQ